MEFTVSVAWETGLNHHLYEDRYRLLGAAVPLVRASGRGHIYAVMDGIGGAPQGMKAAQHLADRLTDFYRDPSIPATDEGLRDLIYDANMEVHGWGYMPGTDRPLGGAAATVAWFTAPADGDDEGRLRLFHIGDTVAYRFFGAGIQRLTRDHGGRKLLDRYFGQGPDMTVDVVQVSQFEEGDWLCLASDGVTKGLTTDQVKAALAEHRSVERAAEEVRIRTRAAKSKDDVTVVLVELDDWEDC